MKKSLITIATMFAAITAQATTPDVEQKQKAETLFQAGSVDVVSSVIEWQEIQASFFDGIRIVRLANGNCQVESHSYTPNAVNPIAGKTSTFAAVVGHNCVLNQPPAHTLAASE